jgi:hypothetical protein
LFLAHMIKSSRRRFFQQQFFDWGCEWFSLALFILLVLLLTGGGKKEHDDEDEKEPPSRDRKSTIFSLSLSLSSQSLFSSVLQNVYYIKETLDKKNIKKSAKRLPFFLAFLKKKEKTLSWWSFLFSLSLSLIFFLPLCLGSHMKP